MREPAVVRIVASFVFQYDLLDLPKMSREMAAEQLKIWESAVDIVAANIPARMSPTISGGSSWSATVGKANSGSNARVSEIMILVVNPARNVQMEKRTYHR